MTKRVVVAILGIGGVVGFIAWLLMGYGWLTRLGITDATQKNAIIAGLLIAILLMTLGLMYLAVQMLD